jgi:multicomponent Na+:H+ antiporter subunit E
MQLGIHAIVVGCWVVWQGTWDGGTVLAGTIAGALALLVMQPFVRSKMYVMHILAAVRLGLVFGWELVRSCVALSVIVLRPTLRIRPCIVHIPTDLQTDVERTLLAHLITLTPGTLTLDIVQKDGAYVLVVHALHVRDVDALISETKRTFERAIMEVTRP